MISTINGGKSNFQMRASNMNPSCSKQNQPHVLETLYVLMIIKITQFVIQYIFNIHLNDEPPTYHNTYCDRNRINLTWTKIKRLCTDKLDLTSNTN